MPAFSSGSPVPFSDVNLRDHVAHAPRWGPDSSTSEVTTIQLEFVDLSRQTGDPKYEVCLVVLLLVLLLFIVLVCFVCFSFCFRSYI